jgi:hypothetical protein
MTREEFIFNYIIHSERPYEAMRYLGEISDHYDKVLDFLQQKNRNSPLKKPPPTTMPGPGERYP